MEYPELSDMKYPDLAEWLDLVDATCLKTFGIGCALDLVDDQIKGIDILKDSFSNDAEPAEGLRNLRLFQARELWEELGTVPVIEGDQIGSAFITPIQTFPQGTPIMTIWRWFEATFECSVPDDLITPILHGSHHPRTQA